MATEAEKKIVVIRHAESAAQAYGKENGNKSRSAAMHLVDCPLSPSGVSAVEKLKVPHNYIQLVVVSPLARALQTACIAFKGQTTPMIVHPCLAEFPTARRMKGVENHGRPMAEIQSCPRLNSFDKFRELDWTELAAYEQEMANDPSVKEWWCLEEGDTRKRNMNKLLEWLAGRQERRIALVGHCNCIMMLVGTKFLIPNATPVECAMRMKPSQDGVHWTIVRQDQVKAVYTHVAYMAGKTATIALHLVKPRSKTTKSRKSKRKSRFVNRPSSAVRPLPEPVAIDVR